MLGTKLKNLPYNWFFKMVLVGVIAVCSIFTARVLFTVMEDGDYFFADNFYETDKFFSVYTDLTEQGILGMNPQDLNRQSSTFRFQAISRDGKVLATNVLDVEDPNTVFESPYALTYTQDATISPEDGVRLRTTHFGDLIASQFGYDVHVNTTIDFANDTGKIGAYYQDFMTFKRIQNLYVYQIGLSLAVAVFAFIWLNFTAGKRAFDAEAKMNLMDKIPLELLPFLCAGALLPVIWTMEESYIVIGGHNSGPTLDVVVGFGALWVAISMVLYLSLVRRIKAGRFWRSAWSVSVLLWFGQFFNLSRWRGGFRPILIAMVLGYGALSVILTLMVIHASDGLVSTSSFALFIALQVWVVYWLQKQLIALKHIMDFVRDQVQGNMTSKLRENEVTPLLAPLARDLSALQTGLEIAIKEGIKGERMRSELITNVTHDLKNPLTSIISYVDLLSKEPQVSESAQQYIGVLQDKSNRLKALIDHLVEASKLSSGIVNVDLEPIDLVAMLSQIAGEFTEGLEQQGLQLIYTPRVEMAPIKADTKMLYRILDNLMSNIIKYALPNTRVFISVEASANGFLCVVKNTSKHPLNIPPEELMERFVRGDLARNTEGNGLGLSIAMNLASALGIDMKIDIDGDLFKVTLGFIV